MKNILTTLFLMTIALALSLSSCISEVCILGNGHQPADGERIVSLRIVDTPEDDAGTRNTRPIPDGERVTFETGNIYLVTPDGTIGRRFEIVASGAPALGPGRRVIGTNPINIEDLRHQDGVYLPSVPAGVREIVVIGNTENTTHTGNVNSNLISGRPINVTTQHNMLRVNLFGRQGLTDTGVNSTIAPYNRIWSATVHVKPTVARFELPSITGTGMIAGFTVDGIFINNYHQNAHISGYIPTRNNTPNLRNHTPASPAQAVAIFEYNAANTSYTTASNNALFYWNVTAAATALNGVDGLTVRPSNQQTSVLHPNEIDASNPYGTTRLRGHVWGFQVFAQDYVRPIPPTQLTTGVVAPQIVIRLSGITLTNGTTIDGVRFVTVGSFYRRVNNARIPVSHIRAGSVYHIVNGIRFDENSLTTIPNANEKDVEVSIDLDVWDGNPATQGGNFRQPGLIGPAQAVCSHAFTLAEAVCNYCGSTNTIRYQWQQRIIGGTWVDAVAGVGANNMPNFTTPILRQTTDFRRRAYCECTPAREIFTSAVRVTVLTPTYQFPGWQTATPTHDQGVEIDGVIWATRNVGAPGTFVAHPADPGMLFQWGSNTGWSDWHGVENGRPTHRWCLTANDWVLASDTDWGSPSDSEWNGLTGTPDQGPCPQGWRLPTNQELLDLVNATPVPGTMGGGVNDYAVFNGNWVNRGAWIAAGAGAFGCQAGTIYGSGGNTIFLPAPGSRCPSGTLMSPGRRGMFWSRQATSLVGAGSLQSINGIGSNVGYNPEHTKNAFSVRCVKDNVAGLSQPYLADAEICPSVINPRPDHPTPGQSFMPIAHNVYHFLVLGYATYNGNNLTSGVTYTWHATSTPTVSASWVPLPVRAGGAAANRNALITKELFDTHNPLYLRRTVTWSDGSTTHTHETRAARVTEPPRAAASSFPVTVPITGAHAGTTHWATRNVDLSTTADTNIPADLRGFAYHPADAGMFFQWNRPFGWYHVVHPSDQPAWDNFVPRRRWNPTFGTPTNRWEPGVSWENIPYDNILVWNNNRGPCPQGFRLPTVNEVRDLLPLITSYSWRASTPCTVVGCAAGHTVATGLFFPAAGVRGGGTGIIQELAHRGSYWTSAVGPGNAPANQPNATADILLFGSASRYHSNFGRAWGFSVRCVKAVPELRQPVFGTTDITTRTVCPGECYITLGAAYRADGEPLVGTVTYVWERSANGTTGWTVVPSVGNLGLRHNIPFNITLPAYFRRIATYQYGAHTLTANASGLLRVTEILRDDDFIPFGGQDLGGRTWATHNVDLDRTGNVTDHPADEGMYFQWGRRFGWELEGLNAQNQVTTRPYNRPARRWNPYIGDWELNPVWDASHVRGNRFPRYGAMLFWPTATDPCRNIDGGSWRLPTAHEVGLLTSNTNHRWLRAIEAAEFGYGCTPGRIFYSGDLEDGNYIFFPAAGSRNSAGNHIRRWDQQRVGEYATASIPYGAGHTTIYNVFTMHDVHHWPNSPNLHHHVTQRQRAYATSARCVRCTAPMLSQPNPPVTSITLPAGYTFGNAIVISGGGAAWGTNEIVPTASITYRWERSITPVGIYPIIWGEPAIMVGTGSNLGGWNINTLDLQVNAYYSGQIRGRYVRRLAIWNSNPSSTGENTINHIREFPGPRIAVQ